MARQTIVLLQNKNDILPLKKNAEKIAVIGPNADNAPMMWGNYNGMPNHTITILDGIKSKLNIKSSKLNVQSSKLFYHPGCDLTYDKVFDCLMGTQCSFQGNYPVLHHTAGCHHGRYA